LEVHGIEIKCSRSDWLNELSQPEKAEAIQQYCNRWWIVVPDKEIVDQSELPKHWGLMTLTRTRLRMVVQAPELQPKPWPREFFVAILQRVMSTNDREVQKIENSARDVIRAEFEERDKSRVENAEEKIRKLEVLIEQFERGSGLRLRYGHRSPQEIGRLVRKIDDLRKPEALRAVKSAGRRLKLLGGELEDLYRQAEKQMKPVQEILDGETDVEENDV
jgi:hypothetical protein